MSLPLIPRSRVAALFAAAGVALLAAQALLPAFPSETSGQVAVAAAHRGAETASALAFLVAGVLIALGVSAMNRLDLGRGRVLTRIGLVLTGIGALWPVAGRAAFNTILVAVTGDGDRSAAVSAVHAVSNSGAFAMFLPLLAAFVFGPALLALGLRRAGVLSIWPAVLWIAGVLVVNAAEDASRAGAAAGMALVAIAIAWIGYATSRTGAVAADSH